MWGRKNKRIQNLEDDVRCLKVSRDANDIKLREMRDELYALKKFLGIRRVSLPASVEMRKIDG